MVMKLINIGFGNMVSAQRLVAIVSPGERTDQADHRTTRKRARQA